MGYRLGYNGPEVDALLQKANIASIINNGWDKLKSTKTNPVNLDNLMTQGNYSISYWMNGPDNLITNGPINISVTKDSSNNTTYQTLYESGKIYIRETTMDSFSGGWISKQSDSEIDIGSSVPSNPCDNYVWIDTSGDSPVIKIYKESSKSWIPATAEDMARASVYDPQGIKQSIPEYLNNKIEEYSLSAAEDDYNAHIIEGEDTGNPIHVTEDEKTTWGNGIDKTAAAELISAMETDLTTYADEQINNTSGIIDTLNDRVSAVSTKIAEHVADTTIHPTEEQIEYWNSKADGDHIHNNDGTVTVSSSNIVGLIPIERLDPSVLERNYTVNSYSEMMALTKNEIQNGDSVYINTLHPSAWFVIDDSKLGSEDISIQESTVNNNSVKWQEFCYGNGKYVAVSFNNIYSAYSNDGLTWGISEISDAPRNWQSVCYGSDKFVAIANNSNYFAYSPDGMNWIESTISETSRNWMAVCYGNGKYIAIASNSNYYAYSDDGITWTENTISETSNWWWDVCYGNDRFITVAFPSNTFAYSTDGLTWTESTIDCSTNFWHSICYGNGRFVITAGLSTLIIAYSTDGLTWTESTIGDVKKKRPQVCYNGERFVAIENNSDATNYIAYSFDAITWTETTISDSAKNFDNIFGANGSLIVVDTTIDYLAYVSFTPSGLVQYAAPTKDLTWNNIEGKPNTLAEYGITTCYTKEEINNLYDTIINSLNSIKSRATALIDEVTVTIPDNFDKTVATNTELSAKINHKIDVLIKNAELDPNLVTTIYNLVNNS